MGGRGPHCLHETVYKCCLHASRGTLHLTLTHLKMSSNKMLLVFCDGTGMDGTLSEPGEPLLVYSHYATVYHPSMPDTDNPSFFLKPLFLKENSDHQYATNVLRLCGYFFALSMMMSLTD